MAKKWLKRNIMANNKKIESLKLREYINVPQIPFPDEPITDEPITMISVHFCRTCVHRLRFALNEHSNKVVQCCELQPSKRSNSGYKTIKVTDKACINYKGE